MSRRNNRVSPATRMWNSARRDALSGLIQSTRDKEARKKEVLKKMEDDRLEQIKKTCLDCNLYGQLDPFDSVDEFPFCSAVEGECEFTSTLMSYREAKIKEADKKRINSANSVSIDWGSTTSYGSTTDIFGGGT